MFNLQDIIKAYDLDKAKCARVLFPENKQPDRALERVLSMESPLDTDQLYRLAKWLRVPVSLLFGSWRATRKEGRIVFQMGEYTAFYDEGVVTITKAGEIFDSLILSEKSISLDSFINIINNKVNGSNSKGSN